MIKRILFSNVLREHSPMLFVFLTEAFEPSLVDNNNQGSLKFSCPSRCVSVVSLEGLAD